MKSSDTAPRQPSGFSLSSCYSIDKHRRRKNLLRRNYFRKVNCVRQNYKPEDVLAAMRAIWRGMSRRQAAKIFNIPRSTLLDKLDGKRPVDASPGPNPFLTKSEERTLESWAIDLHQRGFPLKTEDLKDMAQTLIQSSQRQTSFKNGRPGRSWMRNFLLRHPSVFEISTDMTPGPRRSRTVTTREEVRQWCQQHRRFMASKGLEDIFDHPDRMFNVDHGEFFFDSVSGQLLEQERFDRSEEKDKDKSEHSDQLSSGTDCISMVATFTAAGGMAPLMIVRPEKDESLHKLESLPPGWISTQSRSGLLTSKIFLDYIVTFRKWLDQENITLPVLLLVDGRRSRLNVDVTRYCEEQGIILYCLFPTPRPAISELFSSILIDSLDGINKQNFAAQLHQALSTWAESDKSGSVLPHLQSMLQTLAEVRAEPLRDPSPVSSRNHNHDTVISVQGRHENQVHGLEESDCEFDYELTPVEGEIEIECAASDYCDPYTLALHPALLADPGIPRYLVFDCPPKPNQDTPTLSSGKDIPSLPESDSLQIESECIEDRVDQPGVEAHLIVKPLSSPLPETENRIASVESEIDDVVDTMLSVGTSHKVESGELQPSPIPSEEPFLGFSPDDAPIHKTSLDAHGCRKFMEGFLTEKGFLEDFKAASLSEQWSGVPDAKLLFELWLSVK